MIYTVNRFYEDGGKRTRKVVLSLSNQGSDEKEATKYGNFIQNKGVPGGRWVFVGLVRSDVPNANKVTEIGGAEDRKVLDRTGIDVRKM